MLKKRNVLTVICIAAAMVGACSTSSSSSHEEDNLVETVRESEDSDKGTSVNFDSSDDGIEANELTDEYFTQVMGNGNTYYFSGEKI